MSDFLVPDNDYRVGQSARILAMYGGVPATTHIVKGEETSELEIEEKVVVEPTTIQKSESLSILEAIANGTFNKSHGAQTNLSEDRGVSEETAPESSEGGEDDSEEEKEKKNIKKGVDATLPEMIEKGEITDKIAYGYGSQNEPFKFTKTGKEIKERLPSIVNILIGEKATLEVQMNAIKGQIGVEPSINYSSKIQDSSATAFNRYPYELCEAPYNEMTRSREEATEQNLLCNKYNSLCSMYQSVAEDIATSQVLLANVQDGTKYNLSVNQLVALGFTESPIQKSDGAGLAYGSNGTNEFVKSQQARILSCYNIDIEKGGEGSRGGKVIGRTQSGKPIYANFEHESHKKFTKVDHEDASLTHHSKTEEEFHNGKDEKSDEYHQHRKEMNKHSKAAKDVKDE